MPIKVKCEGCSKIYSLKDELAGKKIRCPKCKGVLEVPSTDSTSTVRMAAPKRPAPSKGPRVPPGQDRTQFTPAPPKGKAQTVSAALCPECGKSMPASAHSCPHCGFNVRLGRKLSITSAIENATREKGVRADGTRYKTREDKADEREEQAKKIQKGLKVLAIFGIFLVGLYGLFIYYRTFMSTSLEDIITKNNIAPVGESPATFSPYRAGSRISIYIPANQINAEKFAGVTAEGSDEDKIAAFAEATRLPVNITAQKIFGNRKDCVLAAIDGIESTFSADKIASGSAIKDSELAVWRLNSDLTKNGALTGALLDFGSDSSAALQTLAKENEISRKAVAKRQATLRYMKKKLEEDATKEDQGNLTPAQVEFKRKIRDMQIKAIDEAIEDESGLYVPPLEDKRARLNIPKAKVHYLKVGGILSFIPVRRMNLKGGMGTWAHSLRENASRVVRPDAKTKYDGNKDGPDNYYFLPVLVVKNYSFESKKLDFSAK